jgi:hypothetical protein
MTIADRIGEAELNAYVDGQLDPAGRVEVEDHLADHPALAARVMADIAMRDALRLAFPLQNTQAEPQSLAWARKLEGALGRRRFVAGFTRLAAAIAIFALGWGASSGWDRLNRLPDQSALLAKATKLGEQVNVRLPQLPKGWSIVDARLADVGKGVQLTFATPQFGRLSLVAHSSDDVGIVFPTVNTGEDTSIHWQLVSDHYELTSNLTGKPLEYAALELYQTLY